MLFNKKEIDKRENSATSVVVVGNTPLAFYLAAVLQEKGVDVVIKVSSEDLKKYGNKKNIVVKYSGKLKENVCFRFVDKLENKVDYCFLASEAQDYKKDFMMLADGIMKETKIVNFSVCLNANFFEKNDMFFHIPAFFDGWFAKSDKVHSLNVVNNIVICCDDELFVELKKLFFETNVVLVKENKSVLKQKKAEMLVRNLLMLVYEKNISAILCDKKKLNVVEEIVREVCLKLFGKEKDVEEKKVLQHLYDVSDDARADFCNKRILMELFKFSEISRENTPNIYEMMSKLIKK